MRASHPILLAALSAVCLPAGARADRTDRALNDKMPAVVKYLQEKGFENVGVLRFRVGVGKKAARFDNVPFNGNLPGRVENLLIMHGGDGEPAVGVIRGAGGTAAANEVGDWFGDERQRKKLFDVEYRLAWGGKKVKADAFLTGVVRVSEDVKKTTVTLLCFDKGDLELKKIAQFTIETDRDVIRDLGYSFAVGQKARESMVTKRSAADMDRAVLDALENELKPSDVAGVAVTVLVDDKPTSLQAAKGDEEGPRWKLECPPPGKAVAVRLKNTTEARMGVVVKLNGLSLFEQQTRAADRCRKWVIKPGKTITLEGFYAPQGQRLALRRFEVLVGDEAKAMKEQLGDRAGLLEIDVFAEGAESDEELEISARGLPPSKDKEKEKEAKAESYKAVRASLLKDARLKTETTVNKRLIIVADKEAIKADKFRTVDFEGHNVGRLAVRVVPRE